MTDHDATLSMITAHPMGQVNAGYTIVGALPMGPGEFIVMGAARVSDEDVSRWYATPGTDYVTWHAYAHAHAVTGGWLYESGNYYPASMGESYRAAMRSMAERAGASQPTQAYACQVTVHPDGPDSSRSLPTFYLLPEVQGMTSTGQAERVAETVADPTGDLAADAHVSLITLMGNTTR